MGIHGQEMLLQEHGQNSHLKTKTSVQGYCPVELIIRKLQRIKLEPTKRLSKGNRACHLS